MTPPDRGCSGGLLGDTPFDVSAGEDAGVDLVAVRCGGSSDAELVGAIAIYRAPAHLLEEYSASPFARRGPAPQSEPAAGSRTESS